MFRDTNAIFVLIVLFTITVSPLFQTTVCKMPYCTELKVFSVENLSCYLLTHQNLPLLT